MVDLAGKVARLDPNKQEGQLYYARPPQPRSRRGRLLGFTLTDGVLRMLVIVASVRQADEVASAWDPEVIDLTDRCYQGECVCL